MNISFETAHFWHNEFKKMVCLKRFEEAAYCWQNYLSWKRRAKVEDMLTEICEEKNFGGVYDR